MSEVACPKYILLEQDLMNCQAVEEHHILVDIVARVFQYMAQRIMLTTYTT